VNAGSVSGSAESIEPLNSSLRRLRAEAVRERRWTTVTIVVGALIVVGMPVVAIIAPRLGLVDPNFQNFNAVLQPPSWSHPLGTDSVGRDLLSRTLSATLVDYEIGLITTYVPLVIGVALGVIAGYARGVLDALIMRATDVIVAFPFLVFVIAFMAVVGVGLQGIYVGFIAFGWAYFARITRAEMLVLREQQFIRAAQTLGLPRWRIVLVHAVPNILRSSLVFSVMSIMLNILGTAGLSYLGLGVQPPRPEWGAIVAEGQQYLFTAWWISTLPGLVVVLVGVGFSLLGDGIADRFGDDVRLAV
jgi:peptide/nickel transport system permease protein